MIVTVSYFKLKWHFKVFKTFIFNEIKDILQVEYSKHRKKLIHKSFALYLSLKLDQKINGFSHILSYGGLGTPGINVFIV